MILSANNLTSGERHQSPHFLSFLLNHSLKHRQSKHMVPNRGRYKHIYPTINRVHIPVVWLCGYLSVCPSRYQTTYNHTRLLSPLSLSLSLSHAHKIQMPNNKVIPLASEINTIPRTSINTGRCSGGILPHTLSFSLSLFLFLSYSL